MRTAPDNYFVRLDVDPDAAPSNERGRPQNRFDTGESRRKRRKRKRVDGRSIMLILLLFGLGGWFFWANNRPGGVSGTINGFIEKVRGDVANAGSGPDMSNAVKYFSAQYSQTGSYPTPTDNDLSAAGVGIGVDVVNCGSQAVVLQTLTESRLLLSGKDLGEVSGRVPCPASFTKPSPWKAK